MSDASSTPPPIEPGPRQPARPRPGGAAPGPSVTPVPPGPVRPAPAVYSETLVAQSQLAVSVAIAVVLALVVIGVRTSLWPFAIIVLLAVGGVGIYLAGISVEATRSYIEIGQGRRERAPRRISNDEIFAASTAELTWGQVFGVGLPRADKTTRFTVRPGATLVLELRSGEVVRVSTPDPALALAVLGRAPN